MNAVTAITGHGGWPMTVFLMPDGRPFHGGTYFPPEPRYGMPSFLQLLEQVYEAWVIRREDLDNGAQQLVEALQRVQVRRVGERVDRAGAEPGQQRAGDESRSSTRRLGHGAEVPAADGTRVPAPAARRYGVKGCCWMW